MKRCARKSLVIPLLLACAAIRSRAGDPDPPPAPAPQQTNLPGPLTDKGITFPFTYTGEALGNLSGGYKQGAIYEGLAQLGVQIDLDKLAGWSGATLLVSGLYPHGESLTNRYVHDLNVLSNIDANHDPRLYEVWFQQNFDNDKFSVRVGQLLADTEFCISNYGSIFMNSVTGMNPVIGLNLNAPIFPIAAPGVRVRYTANDSFYAQFGAYVGNTGNQYTDNRYGTHFFENNKGAFLLGEIGYTSNPPPKPATGTDSKEQTPVERPLSATYKLGLFYNTNDFDGNNGAGPDADYGIYGVVDQELWHKPGDPDGGLKAFLMVGGAPEDRNSVSFSVCTGLDYQGLIPARDKDICGISFSSIRADGQTTPGAPASAHYETVIEATYQAAVNDHLSVQPDFQCIFNPGATQNLPTAIVAGVRFTLSF